MTGDRLCVGQAAAFWLILDQDPDIEVMRAVIAAAVL
jgi:hypothetical protein